MSDWSKKIHEEVDAIYDKFNKSMAEYRPILQELKKMEDTWLFDDEK